MSRKLAIFIIGFCAVMGLAIGIVVANWNFTDPDVLRAARLLMGAFGMAAGGFGSKWLLLGSNAQ
jgi:hypothetical protein